MSSDPTSLTSATNTSSSLNQANASATSTSLQIETALRHNQNLQNQIAAKIHKIALLKAQNRQKASRLLASYLKDDEDSKEDDDAFPVKSEKFYKAFAKTLRKGLDKTNPDGTRKQPGMKYQAKTIISKWRYPKDGRWREVYFSDPHHDTPVPNSDVAKREKLTANIPSLDDYKWSAAEVKKLKDAVQSVQSADSNDNDGDIDWSAVYVKFHEGGKVDSASKKTKTQLRLKYLYSASPLINKSKFTKDESLKILELVHLSDGQPKWDEVAVKINNNRTPWQCFSHYQSKLNANENSRMLNALEAELLFKHVADQGPTFCFNYLSARKIAKNVLCHRGEYQTYAMARTAVGVNPLLTVGEWTDEEEMTLCLGMKVYKDVPDLKNSSQVPWICAHIPNRSTSQAREKWDRYLRPDYSNEAFTKSDDEAILEAMQEAGDNFQVSDLYSKFPHRCRLSLRRRWEKLTTPEGLEKMSEVAFISRKAAGHKVVQKNQESLLSPDDFVVRRKRKRKT
mmetsp:Transcript_26094/g.40458  ORF Transcript_26094/g.40458 Transcript_26094/m.40458 type:complete len:510 (-) Transcript_26094:42-1571(-)